MKAQPAEEGYDALLEKVERLEQANDRLKRDLGKSARELSHAVDRQHELEALLERRPEGRMR
jgi:hypothetical protein